MFREKLAWIIGVGTGYSWFYLSFFVLLLPCVTHSSCSLPTCLCLSEKRNKLRLFCGAQVFFFPLLLSSVTRTSQSLPACLRLTEKPWKIAPVLQIQASPMKLRVHSFLFLVFLHIKTDGKNKFFLLLKKGKGPYIYLLCYVCFSISWSCCLRSILFLLK